MRLHFGPSGVSSTSMPAALIWSRMASAAAKSFAARASGTLVEQAADEGVHGGGELVVVPARRAPRGVGRVEPEHAQHGAHGGGVAAQRGRVGPGAVGEQLVALADDVEDRGHRRRRTEVVVHRGREVGAVQAGRGDLAEDGAGALEVGLDASEADRGLLERLEAELDVAAVVGRDDVVAQLDATEALQHRRDGQAVAQRLAHLLAGGGDPGVVHPVRREAVPGRAALGLLVLVVREAQVDAAAVDVEGLAEVLAGHRRALDVPAGPARAPGAGPRRGRGLGGLAALPQGEVARVALAAGVGVLGRLHVVEALPGQLAVRRPRAHVEVDVARPVGGGVGVALVHQLLDERDHLGHVGGRGRLVGGRQHVERAVGPVELARHLVGQVPPRPALLGRLGEDLVVDVGDVADERHLEALVGQPAAQHVEVDRRAHVAHVRLRLHRQPAHVHARPALLQGDEVADVARGGVVEPESHGSSVGASPSAPRIPGRAGPLAVHREFHRPADVPGGWTMKLHRPPRSSIGRPMKLPRADL